MMFQGSSGAGFETDPYHLIGATMPQMAWTASPDGVIDYVNPRWLSFTGLSIEESLHNPGWTTAISPDHVEPMLRQWRQAIRCQREFKFEVMVREAESGAYRWHQAHAYPVFASNGAVMKWRGMFTDIEDQKKLALKREFLAAITSTITSSLDYRSCLQNLAALLVPRLGDWCAVSTFEPSGEIKSLHAAWESLERDEAILQELMSFRFEDNSRFGPAAVFRTGRSQLCQNLNDDVLQAAARTNQELRVLLAVKPSSYLCVPLKARGRILGAITLLRLSPNQRHSDEDLCLAEEVARRISLAVDNARLTSEMIAANRLKDEFLTSLSHELRTPLNAILGWSDLLVEEENNSPELELGLKTILRNSKTLAHLIDNILDVSTIITGQLPLQTTELSLAELTERTVASLRSTAESKNLTLKVQVEPNLPPMKGDAIRLRQVIWNLLTNAIKFTPPGGTIDIFIESDAQENLQLRVKDNGIGIKPEFLPHLFEPFRQSDGSLTRKYDGLGLGLTIVKHLVELHGGSVHALSPGVGLGSAFIVTLPSLVVIKSLAVTG